MEELPADLRRHWIHSHEEDTEDFEVYRPSDFAFPPSRGREGFEFREGGEFIYYGIAPADGNLEQPGHWHFEGPNKLSVDLDLENGRTSNLTLDVVSHDSDTLRVKR